MTEVSVVMAVHNGAAHLKECLDSLLSQDGVDFECIVIDDASRDQSVSIVQSYNDSRLILRRHDVNRGLTCCLNEGLQIARSPLIARMDSDDVSLPGRLARQKQKMGREKADIVFCRCEIEGRPGRASKIWRELPAGLRTWRNLFSNYYGVHPAAMFDRQKILEIGGYDEKFLRSQDYDLWDRAAAAKLVFSYDSARLLRYRIHHASISARDSISQFEAGQIVSTRALLRCYPNISKDELSGLQWLMFERSKPASPMQVELSLGYIEERVNAFLAGQKGQISDRLIWQDVAHNLSLRQRKLVGKTQSMANALSLRLALRARTPQLLARVLYHRLKAR